MNISWNCLFIFIGFLLALLYPTANAGATLMDKEKCKNACFDKRECPKNAQCVPLTTTNCGICMCDDGYEQGWFGCHPSKETQTKSPKQDKQDTTTTTTTSSPKKEQKSQSGSSSASSSDSQSLNCANYDCGAKQKSANDSQPFKIRSQNLKSSPSGCKNNVINPKVTCNAPLAGGVTNDCNGVTCFDVTSSKSYCICHFDKIGIGCNEDKAGSCTGASGTVPSNGYVSDNTRFVHATQPDNGGVMGRHFISNLQDCIKLCQWTNGQCRSVNFGEINNKKVCELLSVQVKKGTTLANWLNTQNGWSFACCF